jgi:hypothetical protein
MSQYQRWLASTVLPEIADALWRSQAEHAAHRDPEIREAWGRLHAWEAAVRAATQEAAKLWAVVRGEGRTMRSMEAALAQGEAEHARILPAVAEARSELARRLGARRAEYERWRLRLTHLVEMQCALPEAEAALEEIGGASREVLSLLAEERGALARHQRRSTVGAVARLTALLESSAVSVHTDTDVLLHEIRVLADARDSAVFALVVQLQLRAEGIQRVQQKVESLRRRLGQLVDHGGRLEDIEAALLEVAAAPPEWREALEHERARLRAHYIAASQAVADSMLELMQRNDPDDLGLVEEALAACRGYSHELVQRSWQQLSKHRDHLLTLRRASAMQAEWSAEVARHQAVRQRYEQTKLERIVLEQRVQLLRTEAAAAAAGSGLAPTPAAAATCTFHPVLHAFDTCMICHQTVSCAEYDAHGEACVRELVAFIGTGASQGCMQPSRRRGDDDDDDDDDDDSAMSVSSDDRCSEIGVVVAANGPSGGGGCGRLSGGGGGGMRPPQRPKHAAAADSSAPRRPAVTYR